jgi:hypothetical protein
MQIAQICFKALAFHAAMLSAVQQQQGPCNVYNALDIATFV